jgi:small-conductance mechanosensitive channel
MTRLTNREERTLSANEESPVVKASKSFARLSARFRGSVFALVICLAGLVLAKWFGGVLASDHHSLTAHALALGGSLIFFGFALITVRSATNALLFKLPGHLGDARATALRIICLLVGYVLTITGTLSVLNVPVGRLLLGGVLVSVLAGIAAQQSLGNVFAGLVLLVARPFVVGEHVVIRSGAMGGKLSGTVIDLTLVYVVLDTDEGVIRLPNAAVLAAAVGPVTQASPKVSDHMPAQPEHNSLFFRTFGEPSSAYAMAPRRERDKQEIEPGDDGHTGDASSVDGTRQP